MNVKAFHKIGVCRRPDECKEPFIRQVYAVGKRNVKTFHKAGVCSRQDECKGLHKTGVCSRPDECKGLS
jgi:hypothetical protein